jgi:hypothetical protein
MTRHASWFLQSNPAFLEVLLLIYNIVWHIPAHMIRLEHHFGPSTIADCSQLYKQTMLKYLARC